MIYSLCIAPKWVYYAWTVLPQDASWLGQLRAGYLVRVSRNQDTRTPEHQNTRTPEQDRSLLAQHSTDRPRSRLTSPMATAQARHSGAVTMGSEAGQSHSVRVTECRMHGDKRTVRRTSIATDLGPNSPAVECCDDQLNSPFPRRAALRSRRDAEARIRSTAPDARESASLFQTRDHSERKLARNRQGMRILEAQRRASPQTRGLVSMRRPS